MNTPANTKPAKSRKGYFAGALNGIANCGKSLLTITKRYYAKRLKAPYLCRFFLNLYFKFFTSGIFKSIAEYAEMKNVQNKMRMVKL